MKTLKISRYSSKFKDLWNRFCQDSKNATFLLQRDFMEYHKDRFEDYSLMVFEDEALVAVLPAHKTDYALYSHNGLTYGGLVLSPKVKLPNVLEILKTILKYLENNSIETIDLKPLPKIYESKFTGDLDYALFLVNAKLEKREAASVINLQKPFKIQSNRKEGVKKAKAHQLEIKEEINFNRFWESILIPTLRTQFDVNPVHSLNEITTLANNFPQHIKQFNVYHDNTIIAGATIFETDVVAHTQYIASNEDRQAFGSLDFLFNYLINERYSDKSYFSFGTSNANNGKTLNKGLNYWKECFGARTLVHDTYSINTKNHKLITQSLL